MKERWKAVVGFEGLYEVSDQGRVRSLDRVDGQGRNWPGRILVLSTTRGGYLTVSVGKSRRVNVLVLETFKPPRVQGFDAAHRNGARTDNRLSNLSWKTKAANEADKRTHGTLLHGDSCPWAQLTTKQVRQIRSRNAAGESFAHIARTIGRRYQSVYDAGTGRRWAHV